MKQCRQTGRLVLLLVGIVFLAGEASAASCGPPPRSKPQRRKAGESVPPLPGPGPVTPLRRTERKRPPAPPALVGKIQSGEVVWKTDKEGRRYSFRDWTTDPADARWLIQLANRELHVRYRSINIDLGKFSFDPTETPILYISGHESFAFDDTIRARLRAFLQDGGYLIGDACCGRKPFMEAFVREMKAIFPRRPLRPLPADHPVFRCYHKIDSVEYVGDGKPMGKKAPYLHGINLGCRAAVIFSPFDLSCGWDGHTHEHGERVAVDDARKLGVNMMAYALANWPLGRFLSTEKVYRREGEAPRDHLVFAQVVHDGDWDPHPNGTASFLKYLGGNAAMPVRFKRESVALSQARALYHPFLYLTGHHDFRLGKAEIDGLRNYIRAGGTLFADACCGRAAFDVAFRRELKRALPEFALEPIPLTDPFFTSAAADVRRVTYSRQMQAVRPNANAPALEGFRIGGRWAVIYSRYGIGTHWDRQERPYSLAYSPRDALKLGLDIVIYAMTH